MMFKAAELQIGSCWINQLHWLDENPVVREKLLSLGLCDDETVTCSVVFGYPKVQPKTEVKRTGNVITIVD